MGTIARRCRLSRGRRASAGCCLRNRRRGSRCIKAYRPHRTRRRCRFELRNDLGCASLPATGDAPIEWLERSALDLRLENASFDAVLCQQGLQFFPDKAVALREMRRVLDRGGRLALSVWDCDSLGPYTGAVNAVLGQFVGRHVAARFVASRNAPNPDELKGLTMEAGFSAVI